MKKIEKLTLENFKFFKGEETLNFDSKNVLVYGENGSGKSSLYWALYTFLQSSMKSDDQIKKYFDDTHAERLVNRFKAPSDKSSLKLTLKNSLNIPSTYEISLDNINTNKPLDTEISKANLTSDFINYRLLAKLYHFKNSQDIEIFDMFEDEILQYVNIDGQNFHELWQRLKSGIKPKPKMSDQSYKDFQRDIQYFNEKFEHYLNTLIRKTNEILKENFKESITVLIDYREKATYDAFELGSTTKRNHITLAPKIYLTVEFSRDNYKIDKPHTFLNEARLTAIALSLRFSILKNRLSSDDILKILVLDDLLISLDMSHRIEVINFILNDENLQNYQIIILTHDRGFFEFVKRIINSLSLCNHWIKYEMYEDSSDGFSKPLIMPSKGNLEKAESYFKISDYPAAGNYLRKASEEIIDRKLLNTYKPLENSGLDSMIQMYKKMCTDFSLVIPASILTLEELTKRVFNPSSHDDLHSPLYKKEIEGAIKAVKNISQLDKIGIVKIIDAGAILKYQYQNNYKARYNFIGDINLYKLGENVLNREKIFVGNCGFAINDGSNGWIEQYFERNRTINIKDIFTQTKKYIFEKHNVDIDENDFISNTFLNDTPLNEDLKKLIHKQIS